MVEQTQEPKGAVGKQTLRRGTARPKLSPQYVHQFVEQLVGEDLHAKRVLSLANGVVGVMHAAALAVHFIGEGLAAAEGLDPKHAIKQVDRLLSNRGISLPTLFSRWVPFVVAGRKALRVALDWIDFERDDHTTIALYLLTSHGRATPLMWKTVRKSDLKGQQGQHEDHVIERLHELLAPDVRVTLLADRGFGDQARHQHLEHVGFSFVIRFRENILVQSADGETKPAAQWVPANGRAKLLREALVTADHSKVGAVVCMRAAGMKDAWCLATNRTDLTAAQIVELYGRRFTIEETFRDQKDIRFGMGLSSTHLREERLRPLMEAFSKILLEHQLSRELLGVI